MVTDSVFVLFRGILYFCAAITGLLVAIPIEVNTFQFDGNCILYPTITWTNATYYVMHYGSNWSCKFSFYFNVAVTLYGLVFGAYNIYYFIMLRKDAAAGSRMELRPLIFTEGIRAFTSLVVACIISVGFKHFCDGMTASKFYSSCLNVQQRLKKITELTNGHEYFPGSFYTLLMIAQISSWVAVFVCVAQVVLSYLRVRHNRQQGSAHMFDRATQTTTDTSKIAELEPTA